MFTPFINVPWAPYARMDMTPCIDALKWLSDGARARLISLQFIGCQIDKKRGGVNSK